MKPGAVTVKIFHQAGMTAANTVDVKEPELVDCNAFLGSTFKHRNISHKIRNHRGNNRRRLDRRAMVAPVQPFVTAAQYPGR